MRGEVAGQLIFNKAVTQNYLEELNVVTGPLKWIRESWGDGSVGTTPHRVEELSSALVPMRKLDLGPIPLTPVLGGTDRASHRISAQSV